MSAPDAPRELQLFDVRDVPRDQAKSTKAARGGTVYDGTRRQIRQLARDSGPDQDTRNTWKLRNAGTIAQAESLAASIDRESGDDLSRKQASGVSLSALHSQLDALLARLGPGEVQQRDAFDELLEEWAQP